MATNQNNNENTQMNNNNNTCRCGQGDPNMWTNRPSDNSSEKQQVTCPNCQIIKSGHLFVSSKGIGWTSWKKRWFVLTRTSLIFFRHDPNVPPIRGTEPNATLGGMDLNNSGSVVVKADKKLITVVFPDGRDGRTFTLKTETSEDLNEWKTALEHALIHAPNASSSLGQNGIFRPDSSDQADGPPTEQSNEKLTENSAVIHTPADFALQDENGDPSFLEKALCFIEDYGIKVEGILRQSADVEEVKRRVHDYEQGKDEFLPTEDAHVIGDCIKLVLREMPGYPIPAACCSTLVEVFRTERTGRLDAMRDTIYDTFPDANRLLLQRILRMMLVVASHKTENRMSLQALAACMAPLLLRPLLVGDLEGDFNHSAAGDNSIQLLQAAAAANHAQAIVTILLEEFDHIFDDDDDAYSYTDSEGHGESEDGEYHEGSSNNDIHEDDDDEYDEDDEEEIASHENDDEDEEENVSHDDEDEEHEIEKHSSFEGESHSETETLNPKLVPARSVQNDNVVARFEVTPSQKAEIVDQKETSGPVPVLISYSNVSPQTSEMALQQRDMVSVCVSKGKSLEEKQQMESQMAKLSSVSATHASLSRAFKLSDRNDAAAPGGKQVERADVAAPVGKQLERADVAAPSVKRTAMWGRTSARKNLSMESIEMNNSDDDEYTIQKLESTKIELQTKLATEKKENESLQASLERRKESLHERRLSLEKELEKLREQLKQEKKLRALLETGLTQAQSSGSSLEIDSKVLADLEDVAVQEEEISNLKQKVFDLKGQYNTQLEQSYASLRDFCNKKLNKDAISKKAVLSDESDSIFEDFITAHGLPTPCPPETKKTEANNERRHNNLLPKSVKSSRSSSSSSFCDELTGADKPQEIPTDNNNNNTANIAGTGTGIGTGSNNKPPPSRRFFSRGDNSKREHNDASSSVQKKDEPHSVDLATMLSKKSSSPSSGPFPNSLWRS